MNGEDNKLEEYLKEIEDYPSLDDKEQNELAFKADEEGDDNAKDSLARANLKLVVEIAKKYKYGEPDAHLLDLIKQGNLGLYKAVDAYTLNKHYKESISFSQYATWWIRQAITRKLHTEKN